MKSKILLIMSIMMFSMFLVPTVSAFEWCEWIPFWSCSNDVNNNILNAGPKWVMDYTTDEDFFLWMEDPKVRKTEICLLHKTATGLNELDQHKNLNDRDGNLIVQMNRKKKTIDDVDWYGFCRKIDNDQRDYIKFGDHSTVVTYEEDTLEVTNETGYVLQDVTLEYNTDQCLTNCKAGGHAVLYEDGVLFEDLDFIDGNLNDVIIQDSDIYLVTDVPGTVNSAPKNSNNCTLSQRIDFYNDVGNHGCVETFVENVNFTGPATKEYTLYEFTTLPAGTYDWEIRGSKATLQSIDWAVAFQGFSTDTIREYWAWWNSSWNYQRELSNLTGTFPSINISYDANMNSDFSDVRFLNSDEDTELNFTIRNQVDSDWFYVTIDTNNESVIFMYYGNPSATTSTQNLSDTFYIPTNFYGFDNATTENSLGNNDFNNFGATAAPGYISGGYNYDGNDYMESDNLTGFPTGTTNRTVNMWINSDDISSFRDLGTYGNEAPLQYFHFRQNNNGKMAFLSNGPAMEAPVALSVDTWTMVTMRFDGTNVKIYEDGIETTSQGFALNTGSTHNFHLGSYLGFAEFWDGDIDETAVWSRALSATEILELSTMSDQSDTFILGSEVEDLSINLALITPANNTQFTTSNINFQCNCIATFDNCTAMNLSIDDVVVETITGTGSLNLTSTETVADGNHNWTCTALNQTGFLFNTSTRQFSVDATDPSISISSPVAGYTILLDTQPLDLNYTITDDNLDTCWYDYNNSITVVNCTTNTTFNYILDVNTITLYANDTFGNEANETQTWLVTVNVTDSGFNTPVTEGTNQQFFITIELDPSVQISSAILVYEGVNQSVAVAQNVNEYNMTADFLIPDVVSTQNNTFNWIITLNDSTTFSTENFTQLVNNINIDDCSINTHELFNFPLIDEDSLIAVDNGQSPKIELDLRFFDSTNTIGVFNFTQNTSTNNISVCLNETLESSSFLLTGVIKYNSNFRFPEFYNVDQYTVNNDTFGTVIPLYDLNETTGQEFKITYKNSNFNAEPGALIQIQRLYISEAIYRTVELPKVGGDGTAIGHFVVDDEIYNLIITLDGEVIGTFNDVIAKCQNPSFTDCEININSFSDGGSFGDFSSGDDFSSSLTFDSASRTVTSEFVIPSGVGDLVNLTVSQFFGTSDEIMCSDSLFATAGTLSCVVPASYGNLTGKAVLSKNGVAQKQAALNIQDTPSDKFGASLVFIALMMIMLFIGMSIQENPMFVGIMGVFGMIVLISMNIIFTSSFYGATASTVLWLIVTMVLVLIKGGNRN